MRTGKRVLAGVAAGALGLALIPFVGVGSASAAQSLTVAGSLPARAAVVGTTVTINNSELITGAANTYVLLRIDTAPAAGGVNAQLNNAANVYSVDAGTGAGTAIGAPTNAQGLVVASAAIGADVAAGTGVDIVVPAATQAGTYTFTAWLTAAGNVITNAGGAVPGVGRPFVTGSFTVGGQPTSATLTPASATYGTNAGVVSALTVASLTDANNRPTALAPLETILISQGDGTGVAGLNINSGGAGNPGALTSAANGTRTSAGYPVPVNIGAVAGGTYTLAFSGAQNLTGLFSPTAFSLTIAGTGAATALAVTPAANLVETTAVPSNANKTWNVAVPSTTTSSFTVTAQGTPGQGTTVYLSTGTGAADNASPRIVINGQQVVAAAGVLPDASIGIAVVAVANGSGEATFNVTVTSPTAGKTIAFSTSGTAIAPPAASSAVLTYVSSATAAQTVTTINGAAVAAASTTPLLLANTGSITVGTTVVNGLGGGLSNYLLRAGVQGTPVTNNTTLDSIIGQASTNASGQATVTIPAPAQGTTSATYKIVVTTSNPAVFAGPGNTAYLVNVTYTPSGSPASVTITSSGLAPTAANTEIHPPAVAVPQTLVVSAATAAGRTIGDRATLTASLPAGVNNLVTFTGSNGVLFAPASGNPDINDYVASLTVPTSGSAVQVYAIGTKTGSATVTATSGATVQNGAMTVTPAVAGGARNLEIMAPETATSGDFFNATAMVTDGWGNPVQATGTAPFVALAGISLAAQGPLTLQSGNAVTSTNAEGTFTFLVFAPTGLTGTGTLSVQATGNNVYQLTDASGNPVAVDTPVVGYAKSVPADATPVVVTAGPESQSILILDGYRNGQRIETFGESTGFAEGAILRPWIRFPGEVGFSMGTANILVDDMGDWNWGRKTGKRTAVQIRDEADTLRSNTVIIEAR